MKRIVNVQLVIRKYNGPLTPNPERLFKAILKDVTQIKIDWNKGDLYQATNPWGEQFEVNLSDGPNMWPKSNLPSILTPPNYTPQPGRSKNKRRKSAYELADSMTKGGQVGHNQRSCKGQRSINIGSQPTSQPAKKPASVLTLQVVLSLLVFSACKEAYKWFSAYKFFSACTKYSFWDLWKVCNDYGTVVDVFIQNKKSKAGKRFDFVRFIKVLLSNEGFYNARIVYLGGLWVMIELKSSKTKLKFMQHVGVASWFRRLCNAQSDFVAKERIVWVDIEGVHLNAWSRLTFQKIASKWGEMVELEDGYDDPFARKRICIKTSQTENILESFKIIVKGKVFWARAKEIFVWSPSFKEVPKKVMCSDDESVKTNEEANSLNNGVEESDSDVVSDTYFGDNASIKQDAPKVESDRPPNRSEMSNSRVLKEVANSMDRSSSESINNGIKLKEGGSILEILEEMITVGQTMGFSMEGCTKDMGRLLKHKESKELLSKHKVSFLSIQETKMESVSAMKVKFLWGNYFFDHIISEACGNSGGILCTWDTNFFKKEQHIISDNFVALYGTWITNKQKLLLISVYAPQSVSSKRMLWSYLASLITSWNGESLIIREFNEVKCLSGFDDLVTKSWNSFVLDDSNGVMVDGDWIDDPGLVKQEFRSHFADRFQDPRSRRGSLNFFSPNRLSNDQILDLESSISKDEIRTAVRGCGVDKSPGPDGFTFEFLRKYWVVVRPDFSTAVEWFFEHRDFAIRCNSSFLALIPKVLDSKVVSDYRPISLIGSLYKVVTKILATWLSLVISNIISDVQTAFLPNRQILDGPFIINEILARCKLKKQQAMIFKVDFAKAYDSIRWDFLDDVLISFGFGSKWRSWIRGSLSSGKASILVNGSPTPEFHFHRGLKQRDPLAPFLFLLIMESLHLSFSWAVEAGIFTSFRVDHSITLSHLFYADDAVFIGEWSHSNLKGIMNILRCFSLLSGMSINIQKSHLLGVSIPDNYVVEAAKSIGCSKMKAPFKYLGILVCDNMSSIKDWDEAISKMKKRLSRWKLNTLSVGDGDRKIAWVKWSKVLASKKYGGLGVSSFYALNRAFLFKWNKKDERGIVIRNKARLVAQGHTQEEGIDYDEVFAPVARIEAIRLFLAYASFMGFTVYQIDVKSAFHYGTIDEEVYVMQPPGF
nr:RNA-directed DNA polymerase, eukaryota [Tanacetum cinerariifolium]